MSDLHEIIKMTAALPKADRLDILSFINKLNVKIHPGRDGTRINLDKITEPESSAIYDFVQAKHTIHQLSTLKI